MHGSGEKQNSSNGSKYFITKVPACLSLGKDPGQF